MKLLQEAHGLADHIAHWTIGIEASCTGLSQTTPIFVIHGDIGRCVPIASRAPLAAKLLKIYKSARAHIYDVHRS